eukprot:393669_1
MDAFDDEIDETQEQKSSDDQKKIRNDNMSNKQYVSLLMEPEDTTHTRMCHKGHTLLKKNKNLTNDKCIDCHAYNYGFNPNKQKTTQPEIISFLNKYDIRQIPFGPEKEKTKYFEIWKNKGYDKKWPLHFAGMTGNITKINNLCQMDNINVEQKRTDSNDETPLAYAAWYNQLDAVIELIKNGANPFPPPDRGNKTPFWYASHYKYIALIEFYERFYEFISGIKMNDATNMECLMCYQFDLKYNKNIMNNTMSNYVCCDKCAKLNVKRIKLKMEHNQIVQNYIRKILKTNPAVSIDTLCEMKDVKALYSLLKEIIASGYGEHYTLFLLDIDHFKQINSAITHEGANKKLILLSKILKSLESKTKQEWENLGIPIKRLWVFRQGGDEFSLVVNGYHMKECGIQQKLYLLLKNKINKISVENIRKQKYLTVSVGACLGYKIRDYEDMLKKADDAAETIKKKGRDGIRIWSQHHKGGKGKMFADFNDIKW